MISNNIFLEHNAGTKCVISLVRPYFSLVQFDIGEMTDKYTTNLFNSVINNRSYIICIESSLYIFYYFIIIISFNTNLANTAKFNYFILDIK